MASLPYYPIHWEYLTGKFPNGIPLAVEIGSYAGEWAGGLLENCDVGQLVCIDPWPNEKLWRLWSKRMEKHLQADAVNPMQAFNHQVLDEFPDESIDLVYVDGCHGKANEDIENWWPKIRIGGAMLCHDWQLLAVRRPMRLFFGPGRTEVCYFGPVHYCKSGFVRKVSADPKEGGLP